MRPNPAAGAFPEVPLRCDLLREVRTKRSVRRSLARMREEAVRKSSSGDLEQRLQVFGDAKALAHVMNVEEVGPCAELP